MRMTAIKEHGYNGRRYKPGQSYETLSNNDAKLLQAVGLSKPAVATVIGGLDLSGKVEPPPVARREMKPEPELEISSPPEDRKPKRRYRRKDMIPDEE